MMKYRRHVSRQILTLCLAFAVGVGVLAAAMSVSALRDADAERDGMRIRDAIALTAPRIDVAAIEESMASGAPTEGLHALERVLDDVRQSGVVDFIAVWQPVEAADGCDVKVVASGMLPEERAGGSLHSAALGDGIGASLPEGSLPGRCDDMLNRREIQFTASTRDTGSSMEGTLALVNEAGVGVALLTARVDVAPLGATAGRWCVTLIGGIAAAAVAFLMLMRLWLDRRLVGPLRRITDAAREYAGRSQAQAGPGALAMARPDVRTGDELEALSDALVDMAERVKRCAESAMQSAAHASRDLPADDAALRDALTGVRSRTAFDRACAQLDREIKNGSAVFGLAAVALDGYRHIIEAHGPEMGDTYLKNASALICNTFAHSPVYRVGEDGVAVLLKNVDLASRDVLFRRFRQGMRTDAYLPEWDRVSASLGAAVYDPGRDACADDVLVRADKARVEGRR